MNKLFILLLCCLYLSAYSNNKTLNKLTELNKCWKEQKDVSADILPAYTTRTEKDWIRMHLSLVETTLRNRNTATLSATQKQNRMRCLDLLHGYWQAGNFPLNEDYAYRTPIFIDKHDNFCAVGYLVKATGHEDVSRMIAATTNLAHVREMNYPELDTWAAENGFTKDELAWIQPGYGDPPPYFFCSKIGGGVNGSINEMLADDTIGNLYVGGSFTQVDGTITANNIAYVTEVDSIFSWHDMGTGVNGPVHAIAKYEGNIFVAGHFDTAGGVPVNNIASWNGSAWHSFGCLNGTVHDLVVFKDLLYAVGDFDSCDATAETNFARWNGTEWASIPGIKGRINTIEAIDTYMLMLGGDFSYNDTQVNIISWDPTYSFLLPATGINNEVMDIITNLSTTLAVSKRTHATDTNIIHRYSYPNWEPEHSIFFGSLSTSAFRPLNDHIALNTVYSYDSYYLFGGHFSSSTLPANCFLGNFPGLVPQLATLHLDSAVNKIIMYKNLTVIGGKFKNGNSFSEGTTAALNGICYLNAKYYEAVSDIFKRGTTALYPNPCKTGSTVVVENSFKANHYTLNHITGRQSAADTVSKSSQITVPNVPAGMYIITLSNEAGDKAIQKIVVE